MDGFGTSPNSLWSCAQQLTWLYALQRHARAIDKAMSNLVMLEPHLWLNLKDIKDVVNFLDSPVYTTGSFGPAIDGFEEHITVAQTSSQTMHIAMDTLFFYGPSFPLSMCMIKLPL